MRFATHVVMQFIRSQRINLWWNSEERNGLYSALFSATICLIMLGENREAKWRSFKMIFGFIKRPVIVGVVAMFFIPVLPIAVLISLFVLARRFSQLLYAETEFFCGILGRKMPQPDDHDWPFALIPMNTNGSRFRRFLRGVAYGLPKSRILAKEYAAFAKFRDAEIEYARLPVKNCIVCATMSAGKSTFVNALLGMDVLPARNGAATAKVTSIYDRDGADGLSGFAKKVSGDFTDVCDAADAQTIEGWNNDTEISRIFLRGDLDGIPNRGFKVAIHDTPGTNNSGDGKHHAATMEFLQGLSADVIVYVANAEQLCTTDERTLLQELFDKVIKPRDIPVLFVINKADSIDTEKESVMSLIDNYKAFLQEIGFQNSTVCPMSSKAARLLKMALNGKSECFSDAERDDFPSISRRFTKRLVFDDEVPQQDSHANVGNVIVDGERYDSNMLQTALMHTGIHRIESELERLLITHN